MRLRVDGITEVEAMLDRAGQIDRKIDALRRDFAFGVEGKMKRDAPKGETGFLRSAVFATTQSDEAVFIDYAEYARYVDLGTGRRGGASWEPFLPDEKPVAFRLDWPGMPAPPFMRRSIAEGLKELEDRIDNLAKEIG
jgi:hypothetical protein